MWRGFVSASGSRHGCRFVWCLASPNAVGSALLGGWLRRRLSPKHDPLIFVGVSLEVEQTGLFTRTLYEWFCTVRQISTVAAHNTCKGQSHTFFSPAVIPGKQPSPSTRKHLTRFHVFELKETRREGARYEATIMAQHDCRRILGWGTDAGFEPPDTFKFIACPFVRFATSCQHQYT